MGLEVKKRVVGLVFMDSYVLGVLDNVGIAHSDVPLSIVLMDVFIITLIAKKERVIVTYMVVNDTALRSYKINIRSKYSANE